MLNNIINNCVNNNKTNIATGLLQVSEDGNMTSSTLSFQPTLLHHDKSIMCRAENLKVQGGIAEDTWKLNVFCKYASSVMHNRYKIQLHANGKRKSKIFSGDFHKIIMA